VELFPRLSTGAPGEIIYEPLLLALHGGRVYLEAHRDVYKKSGNLLKAVREWVSEYGLESAVDWERAEKTVRNREGIARDITKGEFGNGKGGAVSFIDHKGQLAGPSFSRRELLRMGALAAAAAVLPRAVQAKIPDNERSLSFYNTHTGENLKTVYWVQGEYVPESLATIDRILRDHRTDDVKAIDTQLLDLLHDVGIRLESRQPIHVISGYRSPASNSFLHEQGRGVALKSLHLEAKAIDLRFPDRDLARVRGVSMALKRGGVGYYPGSNFVHLDVGRVRFW
jgi:uncharacterized protein YcbK (DUF882 family)